MRPEPSPPRRRLLLGGAWLIALTTVSAVAGCKRQRHESSERCAFCGMNIDRASAWSTELVVAGTTVAFDSPKCALSAWRQKKLAVEASRFQEFYTRARRDAGTLVFARGSDVTGPMGAELVPLDPASAAQFKADHAATEVLPLEAITAELLQGI